MKTIKIFLPASNITLTSGNGITAITYSGIYESKAKVYSYTVIGEFTEFEQKENLLTLK